MGVRSRVGFLLLLLPSLVGAEPVRGPRIRVEGVSSRSDFDDAALPGALTRVCARTTDELRAQFEGRGAPYDPGLVRSRRGQKCHVDYVPTIAGFRADPEDRPIRELFVNADGLGFFARRAEGFGDSLDISKVLVRRMPRPVTIILRTGWDLGDDRFEEAVAFHYGERGGQVEWRRSRGSTLSNPWAQDYLKSGRAGGEGRILVTRRLFEGRREDGDTFRPMLDSLKEERFVRSNLSWEGGDLQFARHPRDSERLVLFFGDSARAYWGKDLTQEEYAYVLRREFGADVSVDLSGIVPHVDYFVTFLPLDRIALLSQPMQGNREIAEAAVVALAERFQGEPPATLGELRRRLALPDALSTGRRQVEKLLERAKDEASQGWPRDEDPRLAARMARYVAAQCPASPPDCFTEQAIESFLASDPALLRDWAGAALRSRTESLLDLRLLSVVESQLSREPAATQDKIDAAVDALEELGFRVVRVPRFGGDRELKVPWSGISYVNSLLVERTLFVPRFGLGQAEDRIFEDLVRALPPSYEVVPVFARHMLLNNGGVHCSVATVRQ